MTTIKLQYPVKTNEHEITEVTLRRPKAGDFRRMSKIKGAEVDQTFFLIGALGSLTPEEVDELDGADMQVIGDAIEAFTGTSKG